MMQVPQQVLSLFQPLKAYPWLVLLIMNFFLLWMGMWLDVTANILLFAPILAPLAYSIGIDPIHFSMIFVMNVNLGNITPPVGIILFATQAVGNVKMEPMVRELGPLPLDQSRDDFSDYLSSLYHPLAAAAFRLRHRRAILRLIPPILDILVKSRQ